MRQNLDIQTRFPPAVGLALNRSGLMGEPNFSDSPGMMGYRSSGISGFSENSNVTGGPQSLLGPVPERPPFGRPGITTSHFSGKSYDQHFF